MGSRFPVPQRHLAAHVGQRSRRCEMTTVLPGVTSQPHGPMCRGLSRAWRLLTFSLSECRSSSLISFSLASRMACFVTERMASCVTPS